MSITGWMVAYLARWLPYRSARGLFAIGTPDSHSPLIITANFSLTVKRVRRALAGRNVWLLVADSEGINVWCAAAGGHFSASRIIDAIKVSRLSEKLDHHDAILPALSAPGVDRTAIQRATGFRTHFGPVYADDIPAYLDAGLRKTDAMCRFRFDLKHRLDMLLSMNFPCYAMVAVMVAVLGPRHLVGFTLLFWAAMTILYLLVRIIPGKTGWAQALFAASATVTIWAAIDELLLGNPWRHWNWLIATFAIFFAGGFDLAGIASPRKSDAERLLSRLGWKKLGTLFTEKDLGTVALDVQRCNGCGICREICPLGVFGHPNLDNKANLEKCNLCFACGACVKQCPTAALSIRAD